MVRMAAYYARFPPEHGTLTKGRYRQWKWFQHVQNVRGTPVAPGASRAAGGADEVDEDVHEDAGSDSAAGPGEDEDVARSRLARASSAPHVVVLGGGRAKAASSPEDAAEAESLRVFEMAAAMRGASTSARTRAENVHPYHASIATASGLHGRFNTSSGDDADDGSDEYMARAADDDEEEHEDAGEEPRRSGEDDASGGGARSEPRRDALRAGLRRFEFDSPAAATATRASASTGANQTRFDALLEHAIVTFAPVHRDALRTSQILTALKRVDPGFVPEQYGSPELTYLLRNSSLLKVHRAQWAFLRVFDARREDVTVGLDRYGYRQPAQSDEGVRTVPPRYFATARYS